MKKLVLLSIFSACLMMFAVEAPAQNKTRVRFPAGAHGTTIRGTVRGSAYRDYVLGASSGQNISVTISGSSPSTVFTIFNPDGSNFETGVESSSFRGQLPASGDYVVRVMMMRYQARRKGSISNYTLKISIR